MMNKSAIDYVDFTWNPITGCLHGCNYCYAAKQAMRFCGDIRLNKASDQLQKDENGLYYLDKPFKNAAGSVVPAPIGFEPLFHRYRLPLPAQKLKPANIFVGSMCDLFGNWVPDIWIQEVFEACEAAPQHNYIFLTKNPRRYIELNEKDALPYRKNFWFGSTITAPDDEFIYFPDPPHHSFLSIEPLLRRFGDMQKVVVLCSWVIIGAEGGNQKNKVVPERSWIEDIVSACRESQVPVFMKSSLADIWGEDLIQEYPAGMPPSKAGPLTYCRKCPYHKQIERNYTKKTGAPVWNHFCTSSLRVKKITGSEARTSPLWCPLRGKEAKNGG